MAKSMKARTRVGKRRAPRTCGVGPDLPDSNQGAASFRSWYILNGHQVFSQWQDGNVWGSDFRDASFGDPDGGDLNVTGGSDVPQLYFFQGHGICESSPSDPNDDFLVVCGNFGKPDNVTIGSQTRWGSLGGGHLKFAFLDASCPMELPNLASKWFPVFQGLHIAPRSKGCYQNLANTRTRPMNIKRGGGS